MAKHPTAFYHTLSFFAPPYLFPGYLLRGFSIVVLYMGYWFWEYIRYLHNCKTPEPFLLRAAESRQCFTRICFLSFAENINRDNFPKQAGNFYRLPFWLTFFRQGVFSLSRMRSLNGRIPSSIFPPFFFTWFFIFSPIFPLLPLRFFTRGMFH